MNIYLHRKNVVLLIDGKKLMRGARTVLASLILAAALTGCSYDAGYSHPDSGLDRTSDAYGADDGYGRNDGFGYGFAFGSSYNDGGDFAGPRHYYGY